MKRHIRVSHPESPLRDEVKEEVGKEHNKGWKRLGKVGKEHNNKGWSEKILSRSGNRKQLLEKATLWYLLAFVIKVTLFLLLVA